MNADRRDVGLRFDRDVDGPRDPERRRFDAAGHVAQHLQVGSEHLDRYVGARAREHVIDAVRDRLPHRDVGPRQERQALSDLVQDDFLGTVAHAQVHVDLGRLHALKVLVEFGASRASCRRCNPVHPEQEPLGRGPQPIGLLEAGARYGDDADRQRALVEFG